MEKSYTANDVMQVADTQLYKHCDLNPPGKGVIPVLRHWDPAFNTTSSKMLCFNIESATFMLINLTSNQISWIPVSEHWNDTFLVPIEIQKFSLKSKPG